MMMIPTPPAFVWPCPCNFPWNGNQNKIKAIFQLVTRSTFWNLLTDFNIHWLHSELQTIIYTDLSLLALSTCFLLPLLPLHLSCPPLLETSNILSYFIK